MQPACPDEESIDAFIAGRLPPGQRQAIEVHLDGCASCTEVVTRQLQRGSGGAAATPERRAEGDRFGRYLVLQEAGAGGMGRVYFAYDTRLDRKVALKLLPDPRDSGAIARLLAEAAMMAKLNHPNVVTVYDAGVIDGEAYLSMEPVEGETFERWLAAGRSPREVAVALAAVARGLAAAHAVGVVHRDVKPSNILLAGGRVLITDFGLAVLDRAQPVGIAGTPGYMAPEQWRGEEVGPPADVFGLCATLFRGLYGRPPFPGATLEDVRAATLAGGVATPPAGRVPARLARIALAGLAPDPAQRPTDLGQIAEQLLRDPAVVRARRLKLGGAAGLAGLALAGTWFQVTNPDRRCRAAGQSIAEVRAEPRWSSIAARYRSAGDASQFGVLAARVEQFVSAWQGMHTETCAASFGDQRQSEGLLDVRMACLAQQREVVEALMTALAGGTPEALARGAAAPLPDPVECGVQGNAATKPLPADRAARAAALDVERTIANARASIMVGDLGTARAHADRALASARKLGYEPAIAHALAMQAGLVDRAGNSEPGPEGAAAEPPAARIYLEAMTFAERGRDDLSRARAAIELVIVYVSAGRLAAADAWVALASALVDRIGNPARLRANLAQYVGWLALNREELDKAKHAFAEVIALRERIPRLAKGELVGPRLGLCAAEDDTRLRGDCLRKVASFAETTLGARHPDVATVYNHLATALWNRSETRPEACEFLKRSVSIAERSLDSKNEMVIEGLTLLARCLSEIGQLAEARLRHEDALARTPNLSARRARARANYAHFLTVSGDRAGAVRFQRLALEDERAIYGDAQPPVLRHQRNLAQALRRAGEPAQAVVELDRAIASCASKGVKPAYLPSVLAARARALLDLGRATEAHQAAREAVALAALPGLTSEASEGLLALGLAEAALGRKRSAIGELERALKLRSDGAADLDERAQVAFHLAAVLAEGRAGRLRRGERVCALGREAAERLAQATEEYAVERQGAAALWRALSRRGC